MFGFCCELDAWSITGIPGGGGGGGWWWESRLVVLTWPKAEVGRLLPLLLLLLLLLFSSPAVVLLSGRAGSISGISAFIKPTGFKVVLQCAVDGTWCSNGPGLPEPVTRSVTLPGLLPNPLSGLEPRSKSNSDTQLSKCRSSLCFTAGSIGVVFPVIISGASRYRLTCNAKSKWK